VIRTVKQFTGLPITHYAYINFGGFKDIVDAVGGVDVNVPEANDDLQASGNHPSFAHISKGMQHLDGGRALTFVRARHQFADQDFSRMKNQQIFLKALAKQAMTMTNPFRLPGLADAVSRNVQTDLALSDIMGLALNLRGMDDKNLQSVTMPGYSKLINGLSYVIPDDAGLHEFLVKMKKGEQFVTVVHSTEPSVTIRPSMITLTVRNGAGGQYVYGKTMIVYRNDADSTKALLVQDVMGVGNLVPSRGMYAFTGDIMVIIGKDFDPKKFGTTATIRR
jgi:anionic cell wall polymer biosynthesis LytR-Cps2A-Psr (LCP) family protein